MAVMSKKKPGGASKDQHTSKQMVRLTTALHGLLKEAARRSNRPMSWELKVALLKHFKDVGLDIPPTLE